MEGKPHHHRRREADVRQLTMKHFLMAIARRPDLLASRPANKAA
jgi:hypothetical protein